MLIGDLKRVVCMLCSLPHLLMSYISTTFYTTIFLFHTLRSNLSKSNPSNNSFHPPFLPPPLLPFPHSIEDTKLQSSIPIQLNPTTSTLANTLFLSPSHSLVTLFPAPPPPPHPPPPARPEHQAQAPASASACTPSFSLEGR